MSKTSVEFHKTRFDHHTEMAQVHGENAAAHKAMMEHHADGPEHDLHKTKHALHKRAAASHQNVADYHQHQMKKAADDEMHKSDGQVPAYLEDAIRAAFVKMFGNTVRPTNVSAVVPTAPDFGIRTVPRPGQRALPSGAEAPAVAVEFQKLFATEDSEPLRQ